MGCGCCNIVLILLGILGVVLIILGPILGFVVFPPIVDDQIIESVELKEGTEQFDRWKVTPMPFTFKVYIFNVQNEDDVLNGAKPIVKEVGPYVYNQYREKRDVNYKASDDTLEYNQNLRYTFNPTASLPLTEDDEVTVLNVALQGVFQLTEGQFSKTVNGVWRDMFQDSSSIFHKIKVKNLLFSGYRFCDPATLEGIFYLVARTTCNNVRTQSTSNTIVIENDNTLVFSFFNHKNTTDDGPYVIKAGLEDVNEVGAIQSWKGLRYMDIWTGGENHCNNIRGRDSSIYPPFNNDTSSFDVFNSDICRIVKLRTEGSSTYQDIDGNIATLSKAALSNIDDAECYCTKTTKNLDGAFECFPEGFADLKMCTGAPVIASFPHFLDADPEYSATVEGMSSDVDKHSTFVMIEPATGTPLKGAKRLQFNMVIRPIENIVITEKLTPAIMPILWVEEGVELSDELVEKLKDDYLNKLVALDAVTYTLLGVGIVLFIVGFGGLLYRSR